MKRILYQDLLKWKNNSNRKPLILEGARQVGKTWLLDEFGANEYKHYIKINCDNNPDVKDLFIDYDIKRILRIISAYADKPVVPDETFIFLDEIQELPKALGSLKYFAENAPEYHIAAAGSLLGIKYHQGESFPVGKVDTLKLFPLNFNEFLWAMNENIKEEILASCCWDDIKSLRHSFIELLRQYYFTGGMPACVKEYVQSQDVLKVRELQKSILHDYDDDIAKHAPKSDIAKIRIVWNAIPSQLAKENKKFIYGAIRKGARAAEYENAIQWLCDAGLVHKITRVNKITMPLKFYEDFPAFKLFMNDCGLFGALTDTPIKDILLGNKIFEEYKGAFTEQFVEQQIRSVQNPSLYYYTNDNSTSEIDFVMQQESAALPIEVKAEENLHSRSLKAVLDRDDTLHGLRISMSDFRIEQRFDNLPLYAVSSYFK
ncbi:MAG: ATP-binding protein [Spirochaetales bacterium]|nr:ATP-binding protein [Spirochaetales bacterium]